VTGSLPVLFDLLQRLSGEEGRSEPVIAALWREVDAISAGMLEGTMNDRPMDPIDSTYVEQMNDLASALDSALSGAHFVLLVFDHPERANYITNAEQIDTVKAMREVANRLDPPQ
jgi:hypothetical protein